MKLRFKGRFVTVEKALEILGLPNNDQIDKSDI